MTFYSYSIIEGKWLRPTALNTYDCMWEGARKLSALGFKLRDITTSFVVNDQGADCVVCSFLVPGRTFIATVPSSFVITLVFLPCLL